LDIIFEGSEDDSIGVETCRGLLVASRGHFSSRSPYHSGLPQVPFPKHFCWQNGTMVLYWHKMERWCCTDTKWNDGVVLTQNGTMMLYW